MTTLNMKITGISFASIAAVLFTATLLVTPATAEQVTDACDNPSITAHQAERIAGSLMREYGHTSRLVSPWAFLIRETRCINGQWTVSLDVRNGNWIKRPVVVRIDCTTGKAELA